jgi:hypothetical protein
LSAPGKRVNQVAVAIARTASPRWSMGEMAILAWAIAHLVPQVA